MMNNTPMIIAVLLCGFILDSPFRFFDELIEIDFFVGCQLALITIVFLFISETPPYFHRL
jgi:hypothetical protein